MNPKSRSKEKINQAIINRNPSELDEQVKSPCPFHESQNSKFSSAYLEFHELIKSSLLTDLQLELEDLQIVAEKEMESGRVDGSVYTPEIEESKILLSNGDEDPLCLTHLEVKTGNSLKLLQSAYYSFQDEVPVILAEVAKSEAHLIDYETALGLLDFAANQLKKMHELRNLDKCIPDGYKCSSCGKSDCKYYRDGSERKRKNSLVKEKASQLLGRTDEVIEEVVGIVEDLIRKRDFEIESGREVGDLEL